MSLWPNAVIQTTSERRQSGKKGIAAHERGIYDWDRGGYPRATFPWQRFCRRDELSAVVCRKLRNCLIAGGVQYAASLAAGSNRNEAAILAAGACATAVATT